MDGASTVLIVDDEPSLRLLCRVNLELEGYRVLEAASLDEARALLSAEPVDLALLDVHVGSERGLELLPELRAQEPPAAVVVLSGTSDVTPDVRASVDAVLGKPFELHELTGAIERAVTATKASRA
jgi:DNA-binding response OmpR family regulator